MLEHEGGNFPGDLVNAVIGKRVAPLEGLPIEIEQIGEATAGPEAVADEPDRALYAAFFMSSHYRQ